MKTIYYYRCQKVGSVDKGRYSYFTRSLADTKLYTRFNVEEVILCLNKEFVLLKNCVRKSIIAKSLVPRKIAAFFTSLTDVDEHQKNFLAKRARQIGAAKTIESIFANLNLCWNFLNPSILFKLVHQFELKDVIIQMRRYQTNIQQFRKKTPVDVFCQTMRRKRVTITPEFQKAFSNYLIGTKSLNTLEDIEQFRQVHASRHNLKECALMIQSLHSGNFRSTIKAKEIAPRYLIAIPNVIRDYFLIP